MQAFLTELLGFGTKAPAGFFIIGAGMGTADTLTGEAVRTLAATEEVYLLQNGFASLSPKAEVCAFSELAERAIPVMPALLVSGDVGFFSAAAARAAPPTAG